MKIGIDIREMEKGKMTGIGRYLKNLLDYIAQEDQKNEYILFANQKTEYTTTVKNIKIRVIKGWFAPFWDQVQLPRALKKDKINLFLSPYYKKPFFTPCKSIITIHDLNPLFLPPISMKGWFKNRLYFRTLLKLSSRKVDRIITVSQYSKKDIVEYFRVPEEKIEVICHCVDERYRPISSNSEEVTSKYGIDRKFIFYFGNFNPHKNVKALIEAYYRLPQKTKDKYQLVLGGRRDRYCMSLEKMVKHLKIEERVVFTGFISEEDLPAIYSAAELFVFPSLREGFGLPPLEAMACGTPVITSNTTSLPEVVGEAGILVNPYNVDEIKAAIIEVLTNSTLRNDLIQKGLERSRRFTSEKTTKQILEVFAEVQGEK